MTARGQVEYHLIVHDVDAHHKELIRSIKCASHGQFYGDLRHIQSGDRGNLVWR